MHRRHLIVLLIGLALFSWPMMMLVHELGHITGATVTGGRVNRLVWHPLVFSRTDVAPNPQPLFVVWCGPIIGILIPLLLERLIAFLRAEMTYLFKIFAGFCLIANGAYIGLGVIEGAGDAGDMLRLGTPAWIMIAFGAAAAVVGLWLWHLASFRLGFGRAGEHPTIPASHAYGSLVLGVLVNAIAFAIGDPGT